MHQMVAALGRRTATHWPALVFVACLSFALWAFSVRWHGLLTDSHAFRQTHTAISAYYMVDHFPKLAYETPVLGPPWSIPFELPVYQWVVAGIVSALHTPLDQTARFVAALFFLMTLLPANQLLKCMGVVSSARFICLALLLISPFYEFWSRTCMIESTALFLAMSYLALAAHYLQRPQWNAALLCAGFGVLAGCVKVTTFFPFLAAGSLMIAVRTLQALQSSSYLRAALVGVGRLCLLAGIPVLAVYGWTRFADATKAANPLGAHLTSAHLAAWNFGTLGQRQSMETWTRIFGRINQCFGSNLGVLCIAGLGLCLARRRHWECLFCVLLYAVTPLVFTNLHFVHDYYQYANLIFLVAALGFVITGMMEAGGNARPLVPVLLAVVIASSVSYYFQDYYVRQRINNRFHEPIWNCVQRVTEPEEVVMILGCDWSSEIPYYSRRRALMFPPWEPFEACVAQCQRVVQANRKVGALVVRKPSCQFDQAQLQQLIDTTGLATQPLAVLYGFDVYPLRERRITSQAASMAADAGGNGGDPL